MKKKILSLLLVFVMCLSVLAGCSLWERDDKSYFEATVATITYNDGSVDKISKRELITAFNSYGYNYVQNYGMSMKDAVNQTLESIIEKYLTIKDVKDTVKKIGEELFNDSEKSYLWDQTFDSVYSNLKSYLEDYKDDGTDDSADDSSSNASVFVDYESNIASLEQDADGNWLIKKKVTDKKVKDYYPVHKDENDKAYDFEYYDEETKTYPFKDLLFKNIFSMTEEKAWKVAYNKYLDDIKDNYSYKKYKGDEWFEFEINRVYEILRDNYITEKYEDLHLTANLGYSTTTGTDILKAYSKRVRADYTNYVAHGNISSFESSILSSVSDVDYIVSGKDNAQAGNYFYVAPIKVNVEGLDALKTQKDNKEISIEQYNRGVEKLFDVNSLLVSVRNEQTGEVESKISPKALLSQIQTTLSTKVERRTALDAELADFMTQIETKQTELDAIDDDNDNAKTLRAEIEQLWAEVEATNAEIEDLGVGMAELYRKYFYLYNDEDTNKGKDYNAVFGVDANGEAILPSGYEGDAIKDAIKELYNNGNARVGDISQELVRADDGFYIFFYAGKVDNLFNVVDANFDASTNKDNILVLAKTKINVFSSKTLLDVLFDELDSNNFSVFQNMDMNNLRSNTKSIKRHKDQIKDLYK